ncbi:MAG: cytochrome P450 [Actinobacteria bacterium]|nr:MAG: cytochrome P450 [Actinomycetota bacterium]
MSKTDLDYATVDFFRDAQAFQDPYPYYEWVRAHGPVWHEPKWDIWFITGYDEAIAVYHDQATWSNCNTVAGPFFKFSVPIEGDDITEIIEEHRDELPFSDQLPSFDPPKHTAHRGLLMRLITPKRLKENEEFMWRLSDEVFDEFYKKGECEFVTEYTLPFTLMVIADLLGVPEEDRDEVRANLVHKVRAAKLSHKPLEYLYERFTGYIEDRRRNPRDDIMTEMAHATFPDGSLPPVDDVMKIAANLFAAGGETTARLMATSFKTLGDRPDLQEQLRGDRDLVARFIEENLRLEAPLKGTFRLSRVPTRVGDVDMPAGTIVYVSNAAANRDPRQFENPDEFRLDRANGRQHLGFGHGIHLCAGAPLARAETSVTLQRWFDRTRDIRISEAHYGPPEARRYQYDPSHLVRGLTDLYIEFTPVD